MSSLLCPLMLYTLKKEKRRRSAIFDDSRNTLNNDHQNSEKCQARQYHSVDFRPTQKALVVENFQPTLPDEIRLFKGDHVTIILRDGDWLLVRKDNGAIFSTTTSLDDVRLPSERLVVDHEGFAPSRCFQLIIDCPTLGNLKIPAKYATLPSSSSLKSSTINYRKKVSKFKSLTLPRKWPKFQLVAKNSKRNSQSATSPPLSRRPASPEALANINKFMESIGEDLLHHPVMTIKNDDRSSDDRPIQTQIDARRRNENNTFDEQQFDEMINKKSCRDNSYDSGVTLSEEEVDEELQLDDFDIPGIEGKNAAQEPNSQFGPHLVPLAASLLDSSFSSISLSDDHQQSGGGQRDDQADRSSSGLSTESNSSDLQQRTNSSQGYELIVTEDVRPRFAGDLALRRFDLIFCISKSYGDQTKSTIKTEAIADNAWIWAFCPRTNSYGFVRRDVTRIPIGTII